MLHSYREYIMRLALKLVLLLSILLSSPLLALAEFRIATVDVNRLLNESKEATEKKKGLDEISAKARKKIEEQKNSLVALEKSLKEKKVAPDSKEAEAYRDKVRDFNRLVKDTEDDVKEQFLKINKSLTEHAVNIVKEYAKNNDIDLVIDRGEKSRGPVLFGSPSVDITEEVLKELN